METNELQQVQYEVDGRIARVGLDRPQYRNAQSMRLLRELDECFTRANDDPEVRVVVLSGNGEAFSSGHDLGTPEQVEDRGRRQERIRTEVEEQFDYSWDHFLQMSLRWRDLPKPTIAQVHGWCIFGGWLIASSMDLIVAADGTRFLTNLLQYFPLPFDIGPRKAKELLFDNRVIPAHEALELGFVNRIVPGDELEAEVTALAERIAETPSYTLRMMKLAVNNSQDAMGFRAAIQASHSHYMLSQISNSQWRRKQAREKGEDPTAQPKSLVTKLVEG